MTAFSARRGFTKPITCVRQARLAGVRPQRRRFFCPDAKLWPEGPPFEAGSRGKEDSSTVQVHVRDNNVDQALRALKKKMQREGIFREMKLRRHFEKPSQRRKRERAEAVRRHRKLLRKRMDREGY